MTNESKNTPIYGQKLFQLFYNMGFTYVSVSTDILEFIGKLLAVETSQWLLKPIKKT